VSDMAQFMRRPIDYFRGDCRPAAISALMDYREKTGFHFDRFTSETDPDSITAQDIVAVSMLSVDIPARTSIWLLTEGADRVSELLTQINRDAKIWDDNVEITKGSPAWALWDEVDDLYGMGAAKTSKILAAKRPHLFPILDDVVRESLFGSRLRREVEHEYWNLWRNELQGDAGVELRHAVQSVRSDADYDSSMSVLRVIDIVVWNLDR
jgi:hypothetical protein